MHSLPLADTNWTVIGNVNGQASHKNHRCNLLIRPHAMYRDLYIYIARYQPVKCILAHLEGVLIISNRYKRPGESGLVNETSTAV